MAIIFGFSATYGIIYSVFRFLESEPIVLRSRFYGFLFQRVPFEHFFLDFRIKPRSWLISYFYNSLWNVFIEILRKLLFQMCHVSLILAKLESNYGKWEFFISDRNVFALNFLKFRVSTYLGLRLGIPILRMAKIRL